MKNYFIVYNFISS